ncbi:MAG TPA: hypothetical protein VN690_00085 [Terriglobales bacterium]|nr:hypothetical protein [Terriglobales bacterium]
MLHEESLQSEIAMWGKVQNLLGRGPTTEVVAYCASAGCIRSLQVTTRSAPFPILGYALYHTARVLNSADAGHQALILDQYLRTIGTVPWNDSSDPSGLASRVRGVR